MSSGLYIPTVEGLSLKESEFTTLLEVLDGLYSEHSIFQIPNMCAVLHQNQDDAMNCYNCRFEEEEEESEQDGVEEEEEEEEEKEG